MEIINTCTSGCVADAPVCKKEAPHSTLDEATPHPMSHIDYVKRRRIQSTVSWLPLRSWSLSKGNSNSDVVWCFAQQCWHQVATEPCFLGGSKHVALRFTTSRTKVMPSCLSVLFWCPSPVNHVCGGQITGSRELPREAKLPLLYFPFPVYSFKTTPPPEKPISDFFFLPILQKKRKVLILFIFPLNKSDKKSEQSLSWDSKEMRKYNSQLKNQAVLLKSIGGKGGEHWYSASVP